MLKWFILFVVLLLIYSVIMFLFGKGYGNQEAYDKMKHYKYDNILLKNENDLLRIKNEGLENE